ncbi:MAG: DUF362 domain-containing protein [Patescibacteria group bacterium]
MSKVALHKGEKRTENISSVLEELRSDIEKKLNDKKSIVIKPDLTSAHKQSVSIHLNTLKALLDFLTSITKQEIVIAGSARIGSTEEAFKNFNYYELESDYNVKLIDLYKEEDCEKIEIYSRDLNPVKTRVPKIILNSDFLISVSSLKTDDSVIASMGIKNIAGSFIDRPLNHDGYKAINLSIAKLMEVSPPDLSVIDGFDSIEGEGPARGDLVNMNLALAGLDFLSVDTIGANIMDFNPYKIGYLSHCRENNLGNGDIADISILGNVDMSRVKKHFRPHSKYEDQLKWE